MFFTRAAPLNWYARPSDGAPLPHPGLAQSHPLRLKNASTEPSHTCNNDSPDKFTIKQPTKNLAPANPGLFTIQILVTDRR